MSSKPVLMIVFNRPETTQRVFEAVRAVRPARLYVAADGPRKDHPADAAGTEAVRKIFDQIDWDCQVEKRFLNENRGCRFAPPEAISWFFEREDEGIILEDDCLPSPDFFRFAGEMLDRYRKEPGIMAIGGSCFSDHPASEAAYEFSRIQLTWGWATRRDAWKKFDQEMRDFPEFKARGTIRRLFPEHPYIQWRITRILQKCFEKSPYFYDVWDWMFYYAILKNDGLCIHPNFNLVKNIGAEGATHVMNPFMIQRAFQALPTVLQAPEKMEPNGQNDLRLFRKIHAGDWKDWIRYGLSRITGKDWM